MPSTRGAVGLDRVRPRRPDAPSAQQRPVTVVGQDVDGKRVLYSGQFDEAVGPGVALECSRCGRTSGLSLRGMVGALTPSLHLPLLRRGHPSLARCPACRQLSWVRFRLMTARRPLRTERRRPARS